MVHGRAAETNPTTSTTIKRVSFHDPNANQLPSQPTTQPPLEQIREDPNVCNVINISYSFTKFARFLSGSCTIYKYLLVLNMKLCRDDCIDIKMSITMAALVFLPHLPVVFPKTIYM